jgi:hypothetical protein
LLDKEIVEKVSSPHTILRCGSQLHHALQEISKFPAERDEAALLRPTPKFYGFKVPFTVLSATHAGSIRNLLER